MSQEEILYLKTGLALGACVAFIIVLVVLQVKKAKRGRKKINGKVVNIDWYEKELGGN